VADLLVDSDVFIDHLRRRQALRAGGHRLFYSSITRAELFAGGDEARIRRFLDPLTEIPIDRPIAERAGRLRRTVGIALPDALIAATALVHRMALLSGNTRDFSRVPKLRVRSAPE
jgi:predicted nucleic acid-binding protein